MKMNEMKTAMIRKFGMEHRNTVGFFEVCEKLEGYNVEVLKIAFDFLYNMDIEEE